MSFESVGVPHDLESQRTVIAAVVVSVGAYLGSDGEYTFCLALFT